MIEVKKGNIFNTECQTIVNTVNCVGVMGAGIAYEYRLRYPQMFNKYKKYCSDGSISIGKLWVYDLGKSDSSANFSKILNFPTKNHWQYPTKRGYLEKGLEKFLETYVEQNITSIAFPMLGAGKGGLDGNTSLKIMEDYLSKCEIPVEIWHFDPKATNDLFDNFKTAFITHNEYFLVGKLGLRISEINKIKNALIHEDINSFSGLQRVSGSTITQYLTRSACSL